MSWLSGLAAAGVVPVFPAIGENALAAAEDLALDSRVEFVATPRHAAILLVIGTVGEDNLSELHRLHDQLPHPRATVWWKTNSPHGFADAVRVAEEEDAAARIAGTFRALLGGERQSEPDILPDTPPNPWRGKGDNVAGLRRIANWSGALRAVPEGLGTFGSPSTDARSRLARWLDHAGIGAETEQVLAGDDFGRLLVGLEWQEAMLVVNSIGIETLRRLPEAKDEASKAEPHQHQGEQHQHRHHGHDDHGGGHE